MKKIIIVNASPRKGGNCDVVTDKLISELNDVHVEVFNLREKKVNPCQACDACKGFENAKCIQPDDMGGLISDLDTCDGLVLLSPVYFSELNGPAKTFTDRMYCFFNPTKPGATVASKQGKKVAVIFTCGAGPADVYTKKAEEAGTHFGSAGFSEVKAYVCGGVNPPGACADHPEQMEAVAEIAKWLK